MAKAMVATPVAASARAAKRRSVDWARMSPKPSVNRHVPE